MGGALGGREVARLGKRPLRSRIYDHVDDHDDHDDQKDTMIILTYRCPRPLPAIAAVRRLLLIFRAAGHG